MKILVIGDPHGELPKNLTKISKEKFDLVICTGDLGKANLARKKAFENIKREKQGLERLKETSKDVKDIHNEIHYSTLRVLKELSKKAFVYTIEGNVGIPSKSEIKKQKNKHKLNLPITREKLNSMKKIKLVKNQKRNFNKLKIGFLEYFIDNSWIKEFNEKDKNEIKNAKKQTKKAKEILNKFKDIDILVCHQPPYGVLDKVNFPGIPKHWKGKHAGSKVVLDFIKKYKPKYVFCGHIHEAKGKKKLGKTTIFNAGSNGNYFIIDTKKSKILKSNFLK